MASKPHNIGELISDSLKSSMDSHDEKLSGKILAHNTQVKACNASRRKFTKAYKLQFLKDYAACANAPERGALLRREGLYSSRVSAWKNELCINRPATKKPHKNRSIKQLEREIEQLKKTLAQAEGIIHFQKKVSELLGLHTLPRDSNNVN